jgi:hypothetical protein
LPHVVFVHTVAQLGMASSRSCNPPGRQGRMGKRHKISTQRKEIELTMFSHPHHPHVNTCAVQTPHLQLSESNPFAQLLQLVLVPALKLNAALQAHTGPEMQ